MFVVGSHKPYTPSTPKAAGTQQFFSAPNVFRGQTQEDLYDLVTLLL
jgi:hypothetical protein